MVNVYNHLKAVENWASILRDEKTDINTFRLIADNISLYLGVQLAEYLPLVTKKIKTPVEETETGFINSKKTLLVAVLRSGYPMCMAIRKSMPDASLALVDIKRNEKTAKAKLFYNGLPKNLGGYDQIIIPDPMLATGGSAVMVIDMLKEKGAKKINFASIISAPEGIKKLKDTYRDDITITTCVVDKGLNDKSFIIPGLGDFGDRYFGDEPFNIRDEINNRVLKFHGPRLIGIVDK